MYDFLIIGHGLAGAVLSHELIQSGYKVKVFDESQKNNSSTVAAGLFNPVTGRKMVKTWLADELFQEIMPTYTHLESRLKANFFHPIGIYRPFVDIAEQNDWEGKKTDPTYSRYIRSATQSPNKDFALNDIYGGLHLSMSGYVDIPTLMEASRAHLMDMDAYEEKHFDEQKLEVTTDGVKYEGGSYKKIIFCNGVAAQQSTLFGWLPFTPVKGEILIANANQSIDKIYNRGIFILPAGDKKIKIGATYKNTFEDDQPTESGQSELLEKMKQLTPQKFEVTTGKAGIRPATKDRRPFIGKHPEYEHIYLFNGFGSKGVSLVPFFAKKFVEYIKDNSTLDESVSIERYVSLYSNVGSF